MNQFIMTQDKETARLLAQSGFQMVGETYGRYYFVNNTTLTFDSRMDTNKLVYTDILTV